MSRFFIFLFFLASLLTSGCAYRTTEIVSSDGSRTTTSETVYTPSPVYVAPYYGRYYRDRWDRHYRDYRTCWYEYTRHQHHPVLMCR